MQTCDKVAYETRADAKAVLRSKAYQDKDKVCTKEYQCRDCGKWHHTSQTPHSQHNKRKFRKVIGTEKRVEKYKAYKHETLLKTEGKRRKKNKK